MTGEQTHTQAVITTGIALAVNIAEVYDTCLTASRSGERPCPLDPADFYLFIQQARDTYHTQGITHIGGTAVGVEEAFNVAEAIFMILEATQSRLSLQKLEKLGLNEALTEVAQNGGEKIKPLSTFLFKILRTTCKTANIARNVLTRLQEILLQQGPTIFPETKKILDTTGGYLPA